MKKLHLSMKRAKLCFIVFFILSSSLFTLGYAQYTVLHSFNDTAGAYPEGTLTLSGGAFYGMTNGGGANGYGCVFVMDTNGSAYADIWDFNDTGSNGAYPIGGSLKIAGNKLYGMTGSGGRNDSGVIFSINLNGSGYKDIHDFSGPDGAEPQGSLILHGTQLFGMTYTGGVDISGNIFELDTNGSDYKDLLDFNQTNGWNPFGDVTLIGNKLYGMTAYGGANSDGNIFSIDTNGNNFADLLDFAGSSFPDGASANNILALGGSQFFGMTYQGGGNMDGNVFSVDTNGTDFEDLLDFAGTSAPMGQNPYADVVLSKNLLFGLTSAGGANDSGCIFEVDTTGNGYIDMYDFNSAYGTSPLSDLLISGNNLYGTTVVGGAHALGVVFKFNKVGVGVNEVKAESGELSVYPNPSNGQVTVQFTNSKMLMADDDIQVFNELGEEIYPSYQMGAKFIVDLSSQPAGVYFFKVMSNKGYVVGSGKVVIQK